MALAAPHDDIAAHVVAAAPSDESRHDVKHNYDDKDDATPGSSSVWLRHIVRIPRQAERALGPLDLIEEPPWMPDLKPSSAMRPGSSSPKGMWGCGLGFALQPFGPDRDLAYR